MGMVSSGTLLRREQQITLHALQAFACKAEAYGSTDQKMADDAVVALVFGHGADVAEERIAIGVADRPRSGRALGQIWLLLFTTQRRELVCSAPLLAPSKQARRLV